MKLEKISDSSTNSQLRLPRLISDGMVLQRETKIRIWGWAAPSERVTVDFAGKSYSAIAGSNERWDIILEEMKAGGPYSMEVKAGTSITLKNILIGDVWICSGQSNMVIPMDRVKVIYEDEIANCTNSAIRQFIVPDRYDFDRPNEDLESGNWEAASSDNILKFSAVGYFFAKALFEKYHVPIGLIRASVGGTPVEAWLSEDALRKFPENLKTVEELNSHGYIETIRKKEEEEVNAWFHNINEKDRGLQKDELAWFDLNYDDTNWLNMKLPTSLEEEGLENLKGTVWFRKEIDVPASMIGKLVKLYMGTIVDSDSTYINGILVGSTGYQYPPRRYDVPSNLLRAGKNIIALRIISNNGKGEFIKDKPYRLFTKDQIVNLEGTWKYQVGVAVPESLPSTTFFQYKPLGLYNGMIAPLLNYCIKGVIWYQGESNTDSPKGYYERFSAMIADWRNKWKQGSFPFLYVQLANFMKAKAQPSESNWAELRNEQLRSLDNDNTGMAVTIDIGEWNDLHPLNKKDVGCRLAFLAQNIAYGNKKVIPSGPIYKSMIIEGNKIIISFINTGSGLVVKGGGKLKHFAIAGTDKKFAWAKAIIEGDKVVVWNDEISNPAIVRYAWADNPEGANLYNMEGLPASPFTTER